MAAQGTGELRLTYAELGDRLGISADGARTRAKRAGWPIEQGNDGKARVRVLTANYAAASRPRLFLVDRSMRSIPSSPPRMPIAPAASRRARAHPTMFLGRGPR